MIGTGLWVLSAILGPLVIYAIWRSWQSAQHTNQQAQRGRRPAAREAEHGE